MDPVSTTVPRTAPAATSAPGAAAGRKHQARSAAGPEDADPGSRNSGPPASGRSSPSKIPAEEARAETHRERPPVTRRRGARRDPARVLVRLGHDGVAADRHDLSGQGVRAQLDDVEQRHALQTLDLDERAADPNHGALGSPGSRVRAHARLPRRSPATASTARSTSVGSE